MTGDEARAGIAWRLMRRVAMGTTDAGATYDRYIEHYKCGRAACPSECVVYTPDAGQLRWRASRYQNRGDLIDEVVGMREYVGASWRCPDTHSMLNVIAQKSEREVCETCGRLYGGERPDGVPEHGEVSG